MSLDVTFLALLIRLLNSVRPELVEGWVTTGSTRTGTAYFWAGSIIQRCRSNDDITTKVISSI